MITMMIMITMIKLLGTGMGRSCTSIDKPNKDEFWDGMTNPAMDTSKEDISGGIQDKEKVVEIVSSPPGGPSSIPLTSIKGKVCQRGPERRFIELYYFSWQQHHGHLCEGLRSWEGQHH